MSNQVQCPNCGGYKVNVKNENVIASEKQKRPATFIQKVFIWIFIGYWVLVFIGSVVEKTSSFMIICSGLVVLFFAIAVYGAMKGGGWAQTITVPTLVEYDFQCDICGYSWTWRTDQPYPRVQVHPELIAKGEQKLREDEERRQKQLEDAAALYHLTHKK